MPDSVTRRPARRIATVLATAAGLATAILCGWPGTAHRPTELTPATAPAISPSCDAPPETSADADATAPEALHRTVAAAPPAPPAPDFDAIVARMVALGDRAVALAQNDEHDAAIAIDGEARAALDELLAAFDDAGERSLAALLSTVGHDDDHDMPTRLAVLRVILAADLHRRHHDAESSGERARLDHLVQATLDDMPIDPTVAQIGDMCLDRTPFLGPAHEATIVHLLRLAGAGEFSRAIATHMLLTLWDNLHNSGARSSRELSRLALLQLDDGDPSTVLAACRQLLRDPELRELALAWLRGRDDPQLAEQLATLAAEELEPADALAVLRQLQPQLESTRGLYMGIGTRAPGVLADAYRLHLAADTQPSLRRELVMGTATLPGSTGLDIAQLALEHDPDVDVRLQAMFALTVHGAPEVAEQAIQSLLRDPAVADDPARLEAAVLALENLEHGDPNRIARLGAELRAMSLSATGRERLEKLMARSLPGGGSPR